jgi:DNA polymerase
MASVQNVVSTSLRAGQQFRVGPFVTTIYPEFDFETYSEAGYIWDKQLLKWGSLPGLSKNNRGLKAVGVRNYVRHPSFRLICLAWDLKDGVGPRQWLTGDPPPVELFMYLATGGIIEAWNVGFEWTVWQFHCVPILGWPPLNELQLRCCMAKARACAYPGALEDAGDVLELTERKDKIGHALIRKLTAPRNPTKMNPALCWTPFTATEDFQKFHAYNVQDIRTEAEASSRIPDLSPRELNFWQMDFRINARGMQVHPVWIENCICIFEQAEAKYNSELRSITNHEVEGSTKVAEMRMWMQRKFGITFYDLDEETVEEALSRTDLPPAVLRVLRIRQILAFGSVKKLYAFRSHSTPEGRLYDQYIYYGAHTGLWNGRSVQVSNLYKGIFTKPAEVAHALRLIAFRSLELLEAAYPKEDALEIIASCLRSMIVARPGTRLISADYSSLQAVVTAALAGEEWQLEVFRTHGKIYEATASQLTGTPLQFYLDYKEREKKHHEDRQSWGKLPVLSAGFGAWVSGWKRFGADKIIGSDAEIKKVILRTRDRIPCTVEMWGGQTRNKFKDNERQELYGLEGCAIRAVKEPGRAFGYRGMVYEMFEDTLYCKLPSGGFIRYHAPRLEKSHRDYSSPWELDLTYEGWNSNATKGERGWRRMGLYGGVLTQNNVSHEAREIQADSLLALDTGEDGKSEPYPIVMHTHDEGVAEKEEGRGSAAEYTRIVRDALPHWAKTPDGRPWPVKVPQAWEEYFYGKWED